MCFIIPKATSSFKPITLYIYMLPISPTFKSKEKNLCRFIDSEFVILEFIIYLESRMKL